MPAAHQDAADGQEQRATGCMRHSALGHPAPPDRRPLDPVIERRPPCVDDPWPTAGGLDPGARMAPAPERAARGSQEPVEEHCAEDGVWSLYLGTVLLGRIDERTMKVHG